MSTAECQCRCLPWLYVLVCIDYISRIWSSQYMIRKFELAKSVRDIWSIWAWSGFPFYQVHFFRDGPACRRYRYWPYVPTFSKFQYLTIFEHPAILDLLSSPSTANELTLLVPGTNSAGARWSFLILCGFISYACPLWLHRAILAFRPRYWRLARRSGLVSNRVQSWQILDKSTCITLGG